MKGKKTPLLTVLSGKARWEHKKEVGLALSELSELGFRPLARVRNRLMPFVAMQAFAHTRERSYAVLYDEAQTTWADLFSVGGSSALGALFAVTSAEAPLIGLVAQRPTYFVSVQLPKVGLQVLHGEFLRLRPKRAWAAVSASGLVPAYQALCEADAAWQSENLAGRGAETKMREIVKAAYDRARALRPRDPANEFLDWLRRLRQPESAFPKLPESLTAAAGKGNLEAIKRFLDNGADIDEKSVGFESPLALAALSGQIEAVNLLLERGANPGKARFAMFSPIANAASRGHVRIVQRLLEAGVSSEQKTAALDGARRAKHRVILDLLEGRAVSAQGIEAAKAAEAERSKGAAFKKFMDDSTLLMGREPEEEPLPDRAAAEARVLELLRLGEVRAILGHVDEKDGSALDLAVESGSLPLVRAIVEAHPPKDQISGALIPAADRGLGDIVELLLQAGADPAFSTKTGWTALMVASGRGDFDIVRRLLESGANAKARAEAGQTAITEAAGPFRKQIKELLKQSSGGPPAGGFSVKMLKGSRKVDVETARGAAQFQKAMGQPEWSVAFIEAAPEAAARAYARLHPEHPWHADVARRRLQAEPPFIFIFRLQRNAWTILLRTVGWLEMEDIEQLPEDARLISGLLKTRVVTYMAEDTSACEGYELFKDGESIEKADWMGEVSFRSSRRRKPRFGDDFPDPTFSELGIYLPACWQDTDGDEARLVLGGIAPEAVERLDCFELKAQVCQRGSF